MKYLIGIDAGGTKSELVAYDLSGRVIFKRIGGAGNPAVNLENTVNNIISLTGECTGELGKEGCLFISIGMASVETGNYIELIKKYVERDFGIETTVLNDAEMACVAYFGGGDGILAIAGTGSSCYVQKNGQGEMVGGWGHILGDEGSGYHIVMEAFKSIVYKIDRNMNQDVLSIKLLHEIGGSSRSKIMEFIYNNEKDAIAALFPVIVHAAEAGDALAVWYLEEAARALAELTLAAYEKEFDDHITIGIKGGVFHNSALIRRTYVNELEKHLKSFQIIGEDISATRAVLYLHGRK
ncbi:BadF/BadG/BcrA/BcrD ATPase family protein [Sedimentibacter sp.]|uniref:N-acetylglucosamine kinase n=1 Tax=Sedimentibacter sp. TaxID=1960295 RepID=UPI00289DABC7|nr:BadF/BadG/BcrA/BcrD ATPase family protein [Sedimentibacter sp.]